MKRIAETDLARVALSKGATIEYDGTTLNASRRRSNVVLRSVPDPAPAPPAAPVDVSVVLAAVAQANQQAIDHMADAQGQAVGRLAAAMSAALDKLPPAQAPVKQWVFTIKYDDSYPIKRMESVLATAIR